MSILKQTDFGKFEPLVLEGTHFPPSYYFQDSVLRNEGIFFLTIFAKMALMSMRNQTLDLFKYAV